MSVKLLTLSILYKISARYSNLGCRFFSFSTLNISCHSLLVCRVSAERSTVNRMSFLLYVTCCFSLAAHNILSLCLISVSLINMCISVFLLGFILYGILCASWTWLTISFPMWGFSYNFFKNFLSAFFSFLWYPYNSNVDLFNIVPKVSEAILNLLIPFPLFCPSAVISTTLSCSSLSCSFVSYFAIGSF